MAGVEPVREQLSPERGARGGGAVGPLLRLEGIRKQYGPVTALADVSLSIRAGRGHALVGENGAGKSTLIKVMAGLVAPDDGSLELDADRIVLRSPAEARRRGISLVPQELSLAAHQTVAENVFMGHLPHAGPFVSRARLKRATRRILERLGVHIDPSSRLGAHRPAVQQMVMIARGIANEGRLFIFDEPTAALTGPEIERLFSVIGELKREGAAIVYVSHRLAELRRVTEDLTVLRDGRVAAAFQTADVDEDQLVQAMVGRSIERFFDTRSAHVAERRVALSVRGLSRRGAFDDVSFDIHRGEIVGLAGLVGAGRTEIARALFGIDRYDGGEVRLDDVERRIRTPRDAIAAGFALVPEERKAQALMLDRSISDNIVLPHLGPLSRGRILSERRLRSYSRRASDAMRVRSRSVNAPVRTLSGGNQQKVVLARWLSGEPRVYILDEPTRGIDVGAKAEIYQLIGQLADGGAAVLVISSEMPELLGVCDRILVMRAGALVGDLDAGAATEQSILELAMGTETV